MNSMFRPTRFLMLQSGGLVSNALRGRITRDDYRRFLRSIDPDAEVSEDAVEELFGVMPTCDGAILYQDFIANYHQLLAEDDIDNDPTPRASLKRRLSTVVMTPILQRRDRRNSFMFSATSPDENDRLEELRDQLGEDRFDRFTRIFDRYNQDGRGIVIEEEFINMIQNEDDTLQTRDRIWEHWTKQESDGEQLERLSPITFLELFVDDPDPVSGPPSAASSVHNGGNPAYSSAQTPGGGHLSSLASDIMGLSPQRPSPYFLELFVDDPDPVSGPPSAASSVHNGNPAYSSAQTPGGGHLSSLASDIMGPSPQRPSSYRSSSSRSMVNGFSMPPSLASSMAPSLAPSLAPSTQTTMTRHKRGSSNWSISRAASPPAGDYPNYPKRPSTRYTSVIDNDISVPSSMRGSGPENFTTSDLRGMPAEELQTLVMDFSSELRLVAEQFKSSELQNQKFVEQLTKLKSDGIRKALEFEDLKKTLFDKNATLSTLRSQIDEQKDGLEAHRSVIENLHADQQELLKKSKGLVEEAVEARERVERFQSRESEYLDQIKDLSSSLAELRKLRFVNEDGSLLDADALALTAPRRADTHIAKLEAEVSRLQEEKKTFMSVEQQNKELMNECANLRRLLESHTPAKLESPHFAPVVLPTVPLMQQIDLRKNADGEKLSSLNELFEIQQKQQKKLEEEHHRSKIESERLEEIQRRRAKEIEEEQQKALEEKERLEKMRQTRAKQREEEELRAKQEMERLEKQRRELAEKFEEEQQKAALENKRLEELQRDRAAKLEEEQRQAELEGAKLDELKKQRHQTLKREKAGLREETKRLEELRKQRLAKYEEEQRAAKLESERLEELQRERAAKLEEEQRKAREESERLEELQKQRAAKLEEEKIKAKAELDRLEQIRKERAKKLEAEQRKAREEAERVKKLQAERAAQFEEEQKKAKLEMDRLAKLKRHHTLKLKEEQQKAEMESQRLQEFQRQNSEELNAERKKAQMEHARMEAEKEKEIEELRHKEEMMRKAQEKKDLEDKIATMIDEQKRLQRQKSLALLEKEREEQKLESELEMSNELASLRSHKENALLKEQYFKLIYRVLQFRVENEMRHMRIEAVKMAAEMDFNDDECHTLSRIGGGGGGKHQRTESFDSVRELQLDDDGGAAVDGAPSAHSFDDEKRHEAIAFYEQF